MSTFIQLHFLTNYAPSNLNRDDLGRPKTAKMGGVDRLRISSQSLKRAWRSAELFQQKLAGKIGTRTKLLGVEAYHVMIRNGVDQEDAKAWSKAIAEQFGKLKKADKEFPLRDLEIEQLVHLSPEEGYKAMNLAEKCSIERRAPQKEELKILDTKCSAVDIALFGRMIAATPKHSVEAAVQVAHAITVNQVIIEDDYFTAVDDLNKKLHVAGSAHIGEQGFGSGLFYSYCCINKTALLEHLQDENLVNAVIQTLTEVAATISPSGKQNSFGSHARASYILAEKGEQQPRQLSSAFLKPVEGAFMVAESVDRLQHLVKNMDTVYGSCADARYAINVESGMGSFEKLLSFVGA